MNAVFVKSVYSVVEGPCGGDVDVIGDCVVANTFCGKAGATACGIVANTLCGKPGVTASDDPFLDMNAEPKAPIGVCADKIFGTFV